MRNLFEMVGVKDLSGLTIIRRDSSRGLIIKDKKIAMVHSKLYNYYKVPGGGIEENETKVEALIREVKEEAGLVVIPSSIIEYGMVHRVHLSTSMENTCFIQDNYYYLCDVKVDITSQDLDEYENKEGFHLVFVDPLVAIKTNREENHGPKSKSMLEREALVLELLMKEGLL